MRSSLLQRRDRSSARDRSRHPPVTNDFFRPGALARPVTPPAAPRVDVHIHLGQYWPDLTRNSYGPAVDFTVQGILRELDGERIGFGVLLQLQTSPSVEETLREGAEMLAQSGGRLLRTSTVDPSRGEEEVARAVALWETTPELAAIKLY